jgi:hypothetical protein
MPSIFSPSSNSDISNMPHSQYATSMYHWLERRNRLQHQAREKAKILGYPLIEGHHQDLQCDNHVIIGNSNRITGNGNIIMGDYNHITGSNNQFNGNYITVFRTKNTPPSYNQAPPSYNQATQAPQTTQVIKTTCI